MSAAPAHFSRGSDAVQAERASRGSRGAVSRVVARTARAMARECGALGAPAPKLRRCPFCGAAACLAGEGGAPGSEGLRWYVFCLSRRCEACGPERATPAGARRAWNDSPDAKLLRSIRRDQEAHPFP